MLALHVFTTELDPCTTELASFLHYGAFFQQQELSLLVPEEWLSKPVGRLPKVATWHKATHDPMGQMYVQLDAQDLHDPPYDED